MFFFNQSINKSKNCRLAGWKQKLQTEGSLMIVNVLDLGIDINADIVHMHYICTLVVIKSKRNAF